MNGYLAQGGGSGGAGGAGARTAPPIPGLEQGTPQVGRPVAPAPPGQPGAATSLPSGPRTAEQIRQDIQTQIRNSARNGGNPTINIPPDFNFRNAVPQGAVDISVAFFVTVAVIIVGTPLARAFARRMDTQNAERLSGSRDIGPQIAQLQESVDAMALELERITEAQRFQSKLMAGKDAEPAKLSK